MRTNCSSSFCFFTWMDSCTEIWKYKCEEQSVNAQDTSFQVCLVQSKSYTYTSALISSSFHIVLPWDPVLFEIPNMASSPASGLFSMGFPPSMMGQRVSTSTGSGGLQPGWPTAAHYAWSKSRTLLATGFLCYKIMIEKAFTYKDIMKINGIMFINTPHNAQHIL